MRGPSARQDNDELTLRGLARFRSMSLLCAMQMVFLPVFSVRLQAQTANVIVPDGRTGTSLQTSGSVTNVTTSTVSGANAFNSFSQFSVGQGNTVNLQLPTGTQNLVNIVRDAPVYVNGTLNSYMNGAIGGNVYFADPKGFVVGRSGTVNVGSLNVSTPTREFTDSLIGPQGQINGSAVGNLMAGSFPVSPDGNIRIYGRVNAMDGVRLTGQNVYVGGASQRDIANLDHAAKFAASVNSKGLRSASAITVSNGSIHIGAVNNASVNGRLTARSKSATPSNITVEAGNNIDIGKNAKLSAASTTGDAGGVLLKAGQNLTVAGGASIDASSKTGNAGLVDFSAKGIIEVGNGVSINVAAENGKTGTLLIDPTDLVIGDAAQGDTGVNYSNDSVKNAVAGLSAGATYLLQADNSITLAAHAVIDARWLDSATKTHSVGNALNVEIVAPSINITNGAKILAQAINTGGTTYTNGNVTLTASASDSRLSGLATATTGITVDGQIAGGNITIGATSTASSDYTASTGGIFALVADSIGGSIFGLNGGYVAANATATVNINSHANISGSGNVSISAHGSETAADPVIASSLGGAVPFAIGVVVGQLTGNVTANVASGATISAGGSLAISAVNDANLNVAAVGATPNGALAATVAYSQGSVTTTANVATGANLSVGTASGSTGGFVLNAVNDNSFKTAATSVVTSSLDTTGGAGGAVAYSDISTSATATLGASLGTSASNRMNGSVVVEASSNTSNNSTMASTIIGSPTLIAAIQGVAVVASIADGPNLITALMSSRTPASLNFKAAAALSIAESSQSATAAIAQNPSGGAPSIYASGDVAVVSNVVDQGVRSQATSSAIVAYPDREPVAVSAAVAWGEYTHNSNAYVGTGTTINASRIGIASNVVLPITNTWLQWDGATQVLSHLNGSLGAAGDILTSYASATADGASTAAISGSLNHFVVNNNTTAWVGSGASMTATCTAAVCANNSWSPTLTGATQSFAGSMNILATTSTSSIDAAGNVGTLIINGVSSGGSSGGGSVNLVQFNSNTIAGVSNNVTLNSSDNIAINAVTSDLFFGVAPSSGKAAGLLALSGITSIAIVNNKTHASISGSASATAPTVNILAQQDLSVITLAGAMDMGEKSAVGLAVAYLGASTDTAAYIGDNHLDIRPGTFSSDDPFAGSGGGNGTFGVDNLAVSATTAGRITAIAIAATVSSPASSLTDKASAAGGAATGGTSGIAAAASKISQSSGSSTSGFSVDLAGSSAVSDISLGTSAYISGVTINRAPSSTAAASTLVQALNNTIVDDASGSAAFNFAGGSSAKAAIGGAIASLMSSNATKAYIDNTAINDHKAVSVQALNGGQQTVVALGVDGSDGNAVSLSGSVGIITDSVNAYIQNSRLVGISTGGSRAVEVDAYQTTNVAIGGGSLYMSGGQVGIGIALTYASIGDPTGGKAADAHIFGTSISNYDTLTVLADNASVIGAGAASGGASTNGNGLAGAVVVDEITSTTTAYIASNSTVNISVTGAVIVTADSVDVSALDTALHNLVKKTNNNQLASDNCTTSSGTQACIDFSAAALNGGTGNAPGAGIISVAGVVQGGLKTNVGASMVYDNIATTHSAYIADVLLASSSGNVAVTASDSSKIQSVAIGFGLSTGQFAGIGGMTISSIANTVSASVGDGDSTVARSSISAAGLSVTAKDVASITGIAAVGGGSSQGSAVGLSVVYSSIANNVSAGLTGSLVNSSGNVGVNASSTATISTGAVGIAMSTQVGLAGSVATNLMGTNVTADITGGADVTATNNVGVIAKNSDTAAVYAGAVAISTGAAGGAGSLVANQITGTTQAYISGGTTKVDALGTSSSDTLSVDGGRLAQAIDLGAFQSPTDLTPNLNESQDHVRGLAVVASSHQAVVTNVASVAASSGIAIMINPITSVMSGATKAYIDGASIDTRLTSTTLAPQIEVAASSFSYSGAFGAGIVPPTGTGGGGATIISTTMSRDTRAYITNATIGGVQSSSPTVGAVTVKANAEQDASSVAMGFNTGSVGLNVFLATTEAYVDGGALTASSLTVNANDSTGIFSANGSAAYGSQAAVAAAFLVQVSANRTEAYVGDEFHYQGNGAAHTTAINLTGALDVEANTIDRFQAYSVGGSLATGSAAVAGMANIEIANNTTIAGVYDATLQSPTGGAAGAVTISANEDVAIKEIAGAIAIGASGSGVGVGAAANVIVFKSQTTAESRNSNLKSSGAINVGALSTKEVLSYAVTTGAGGSVGIGATVGVVIIGTNTADPDTQGQQTGQLNQNGNGTIAAVNSGTSSSHGSDAVASGTAGNPNNANVTSTYDVSSVLTGGNDGVTAQIAGGNVTGTQVNVAATSANATKMYLLGAGFGKDVGVGAGIGYTSVSSSVLANLSAVVSAPTVNVAAQVKDADTGPYSGKTIDTEAIAGGAALYFGADAAVAVGNVANTVTAQLGGQVTGTGGSGAAVMARDSSTQVVFTGGVTAGAAAVGASIAMAGRSSSVAAKVLPNAVIDVSTLAVGAGEAGALTTTATALGGGIIAGDGADAASSEISTVVAEIGSGASITTPATGVGTLVSASITPNLSSSAIGVSVGGAAIGVSIAKSTITAHVTADVGDNASFSGGALAVTAMALVPTGGTTTYAWSLAGGGGSLIGAQGSGATASDNATVSAYGGTGITLPNSDVVIAAQNDSAQYAEASGLSTGFLAIGATVAEASSSAHTYAYLGAPANMDAAHLNHAGYTGILQITATGTDTNVANATVGAGGTYAGAAAVATTSTTAVTNARFDGGTTDDTLYFGGLNIRAKHTTNYAASGDAFQASTAGASGGKAKNDVTSTTTAEVGTHLIINSAGGDMDVIANDIVNQAGGGARSGSGGSAAGVAVALSDTHVTQTVNTNIDAGTILSLNADPRTTTGAINIEAYNTLSTTDTVSLIAAGVFAGGGAESDMTANATLAVNIQARELFSAGNIYIGSASRMSASNFANASLYGAVSGVGASTNSWMHANQSVDVGSSSTIEAWGKINIAAGLAGDGSVYSSVAANATTVVYNNTAVPISGLYRGTANADDDTSLTLAIGSKVLGANDISLTATPGQVTASGLGSNYNPYLEMFSAKNSDNHSHINDGGTGTVALNGLVVAGIHNDETITIALGATTPTLSTTSPYDPLTLEYVSDVNHFNPVKSWNHQTIQYTIVGGFNPYQTIVSQLATLSGLTTAQVQTALAAAQPSITFSGSDPTGDIQRQINTLIQQAPFAANASGNAFAFGDILVSGGNVSIIAQRLTGAGGAGNVAPSVIARSSPLIKIENQGLDFIALSNLTITNVTGGLVTHPDVAAGSSSNVTFTSNNSATPLIDISAIYNSKDPNTGLGIDQNGNTLTRTPDIYFDGVVTNEQGLLKITNNLGNVVASQTLDAATIQMVVPNGSFTFNGGVGSIFSTNHDVASQWANVEYKPADNDTLTAVMAAATYLGAYGDYYSGVHIGGGGNHPYFYYCCTDGDHEVQGTASNSTVFTARMLDLYYDGLSLYSAIFLPMGSGAPGNGNPNAGSVPSTSVLATIEGPTTQTITTAPWQQHTYDNQGVYSGTSHQSPNHLDVYSTPFNCAGCAAYFQVINIQNEVITPKTADTALNPPANAPFIVGKAIILSASVLNINGTIQSGSSSNYSVNIGTSALNAINALKADSTAFAQAQTNAQHGTYVDLTQYLSKVSGTDVQVGAKYNAASDQIILNSVVQGSGGYVYLNGRIISTSTENNVSQGNIIVNGGAGTITVNNTTGLQLVTNTINTGVSAASVIQIVDQLKQQTTWYVYNPAAPGGQQVSTYRTDSVTASQYNASMLAGVSGTAGLQYTPQANMYYQWVDTATLDRPGDSTQFDYGWHYTPNSTTGAIWTRTTSLVSNVQQATGGGTTGQLQSTNFQEVVTATGSYHNAGGNTHPNYCCGADYQYDWYQMIFDHLTLTLTNTVKASNPINIQFNGGGTSTVAVTSNSGIVINGPINNLQGTTSVIATGANSAITVGANANNPVISGTSVTLSAAGGIGTIGAGGAPVSVQVYGGSLTANTIDHDIAIAAVGSLSINQVKVNSTVAGNAPQGSVFISATGDINSASPYNVANPVVVGKNIEINSTNGAIGAKSGVSNGTAVLTDINPLVIQATGTTLADGSVDGGVLNSSSKTGTYIVQSKGDLRLGTIESKAGPVFLEAAASDGSHASILNGLSSGGLTAEQSAHLADVWTSLDLLSGNAATAAVNSYQTMVTAAYNDYFQLKNIAFANGTYDPTSVGLTVLRAQVAAKLGIAPADVTTTQMQVEATTRFLKDQFLLGKISTDELKSSLTALLGTAPADPLATVFGSTLSSNLFTKLFDGVATDQQFMPTNPTLQTALGHYSSNYTYTLASTEKLYGMITAGSQWTQSQLAYTVSSAAVGAPPPPIDDTVVPNIKANQVMLYTPNGSVGQLAAPQTFTFTSVNASSLTAAQKELLASAGPGQLAVNSSTDATTGVVTYNVTLSQQSLVILDDPAAVTAKALSEIYLGSKNSLVLGGIDAAKYGPIAAAQASGIQVTGRGDVKLDAVSNISAGVTGVPLISGDIPNLTLIAEHGNIGSAGAAGSDPAANANAIQIAFASPTTDHLDQVSSGQGSIYVKQTTGDLILGNISANGAIQLAATGSIYAEGGSNFADRTAVHIVGSDLDLRAGGDISFNGTTFQPLQVKISGAITGSSVGDLSILAVAGNLTIGATGDYGTLTAVGTLTLNVPHGAISINADVTSVGLMQLLANGAVTFADGTSAAPVAATSSAGGVTLASATLSMGLYSAIKAAGVISVTTTGDATLGQLNSSLSYAAASNAPSIIVTAGGVASLGAIVGNGDGQTNFVASGTGAELSLSASNGIGTATNRVGFNAARLSASTSDGGIYLKALTDTEASLLSAVKGSVDILGTGGLTLDQVLAGTATGASGSFSAVANNGSIVIGTADSSGSQTVHASQNVTFKALTATGNSGDVGNVSVTADNGFIQAQTVTSGGATTLGSISASGSAALVAGTTITGNTLAATTGSGLLTAGGPINWNLLNVATTLGVTAGQGSIAFRTAQSGGTQTIHAHDNVTFNALTATGINGDAGSINVNADNGFILAQTVLAGGVTTLGSVTANGSAKLIAAGTNTGHNLVASTGNAVLQGTIVHWDNLDVGGSLGITATAGAINLGTAISGGMQTLHALNDIVFTQLTTTGIPGDAGDIDLRSDLGAIRGGSITANGDTHFNSAGPITLDRISGNTVKLSSPGDLTIGFVSAVRELDLAADTINVAGKQIRSTPPIPLIMNVTGYNGGTATSANISLDADSVIVNQFKVVDANFLTDAHAIAIVNGYVPGRLVLTTATEQVLLNNRSPAPVNWPTLQLYQPGGVFTLTQIGNASISNAYVVFYTGDISATVTNFGPTHTCCNDFTGASMMRNVSVDGESGESIDTWLAQRGAGTFHLLGLSGHARLEALLTPRPVETIGSGPAVNIEGLNDWRKLRRQGQRTGRPGWKDAAVNVSTKPAVSRLAEAW